MKTIIIILTCVAIYSCGSDTVTNNVVNPTHDTVIVLQKDSIYTGTAFSTRDSLSDTIITNIDTLYGSFTLSSENVKTIYAYVNTFTINRTYTVTPNDENFTFSLPVNQSNYIFKIYLQIVEALTPIYRASLRNIKIWYVK